MNVSWKTIITAGIAAAGVIFTQIGYGLDDNPNTTTNWDLIMKTVGTFLTLSGLMSFGFVARDNKVSDEQAGAGRT